MKRLHEVLLVWIAANILIGTSFLFTNFFWFLFPLSLAFLIFISLKRLNSRLKLTFTRTDLLYGLLSGTLLYIVFFITYLLIKILELPLLAFIQDLYTIVGPKAWWHYVLLIFIIVPGEEIFWRRYLQPKVIEAYGIYVGVIGAACLYAFAHIWTGNPLLVAAAVTAGLAWGALYQWKKSVTLIILSHLVFDIWLLVLYPLNF